MSYGCTTVISADKLDRTCKTAAWIISRTVALITGASRSGSIYGVPCEFHKSRALLICHVSPSGHSLAFLLQLRLEISLALLDGLGLHLGFLGVVDRALFRWSYV